MSSNTSSEADVLDFETHTVNHAVYLTAAKALNRHRGERCQKDPVSMSRVKK